MVSGNEGLERAVWTEPVPGLLRRDFESFDALRGYFEDAMLHHTFDGKSTKVIGTTLYVWDRASRASSDRAAAGSMDEGEPSA